MSEFAIADLPVVDDLNVPVDPETYQDQQNPAPPKPGNYRLVVTKQTVRTTKEGKLALTDGKFPTVVLQTASIIEPQENERKFGLFQDVRFKPFERKGAGGVATVASDLYDLLRAYDATVRIEDYDHAKLLLQEYFDQNASFLAQLTWGGYDAQFVKDEFAKIGGKELATKEVANQIYNTARKRAKDFVQNGVLVPSIIGPSGNVIDAKVHIARYYPSTTDIGGKELRELGPFVKVK
jgi:hypothetical protein